MNPKRNFSRKSTSAFSRTDLLVLLVLIAAVAAALLLSLGGDQEQKRRVRCAANLRQIGVAMSLYARDYHGLLPDCTRNNPSFFGSHWPWDLNLNVVRELERRGAGRQVLYCPSNAEMDGDRRWNFYKYEPAPIRVVGYAFLMNGCAQVPRGLWRTNLLGDGIRPPAETELAFDAILSQEGSYDHIQGKWIDRSSHLDRQGHPLGGNLLFEDGHVQWRDFSEMRHRIFGDAVWDF